MVFEDITRKRKIGIQPVANGIVSVGPIKNFMYRNFYSEMSSHPSLFNGKWNVDQKFTNKMEKNLESSFNKVV
jgi:hypothetical protein